MIRAAHSGAQHPPQKFPIVVVSGARMTQAAFVQPLVGDSVFERQAGVIDRPGSPRCRGLRELASAIAARKSQTRATRPGSRAIERLDSELVALPRRLVVDSRVGVDCVAQLVTAGALRRAECFAPYATAPPSDPRSIWIF